jgi:uncharacterized damage-inducible protein DinB
MESLDQVIKQYRLLTDWYVSVLEDVSDKDGSRTINDQTNSLEWLAGHLLTGRYRNLVRIGAQIEPYKHLDKYINQAIPPPNAVAFNSNTRYPTLAESKEQWSEYANIFLSTLENIDESFLKNKLPFPMPSGGTTVEDALGFVALHESYHIGQMSILRKLLGYKPMQLALRK